MDIKVKLIISIMKVLGEVQSLIHKLIIVIVIVLIRGRIRERGVALTDLIIKI